MDETQFRELLDEDRGLALGDPVTVFWTSCGRHFSARGKITKVNEKSVRVGLEEHVGKDWYGGYKVGHQISAPRVMSEQWNLTHCVRKVKEGHPC